MFAENLCLNPWLSLVGYENKKAGAVRGY